MRKYQELLIILVGYIVAVLLGILVSTLFSVNLVLEILIIDLVATIIIYLFSIIFKNASFYDPYWSVIPPVLVLYAMISLNSFGATNILVLIAISIWAIRLTYNWATEWTNMNKQDWRYDLIKDNTKKFYPLVSFVGIMLMPTIIVFLQVAVLVKVIEANSDISLLSMVFIILILVATLIQGISDIQMRNFRKRKVKPAVINEGLWKYSRHPNYFAEIFVWISAYGIYLSVYGRFDYYVIAPIAMIALFMFISIPLMEKKMLKSRPSYLEYQKNVSMIIPWKPKVKETKTVNE